MILPWGSNSLAKWLALEEPLIDDLIEGPAPSRARRAAIRFHEIVEKKCTLPVALHPQGSHR